MTAQTHHDVIPLWPDGVPDTAAWTQVEQEDYMPSPADFKIVRNVTVPTLTVFLPERSRANGTGIIVAPGGGLQILAVEHEGTEVAEWLNERGIAAFVLKYRVIETPATAEERDRESQNTDIMERLRQLRRDHGPIATADGQQAVEIVRARAAEWGLDSHRIGMMGFSAGGFVSASVALANAPASRLDFVAPIYGAMWDEITVPADAPPFFTAVATDDRIAVEPCVRIYEVWRKAERPAEIHVYAQGGHGFGMRKQGMPVDGWIDRFGEWLGSLGMM